MQEKLLTYVDPAATRRRRGVRRLSVYLGLVVLLAAASLFAVNSRGGAAPKLRLIHPRNGGCAVPFTKSVTDGAGVTTSLSVCISQEGNMTSLSYPDASVGHQQLSFDAYCLQDFTSGSPVYYTDFGGAPGVPPSSGLGPATITEPNGANSNPIKVIRSTTDGRFQVSEYIAVNFVPRSIALVVSVKNISGSGRKIVFARAVAPKVDGDASDDQYNEFGISGGIGTTGEAFQSPGPNTDQFAISVASKDGTHDPFTGADPLADWQSAANAGGSCLGGDHPDNPGYTTGGNRVFIALANPAPLVLANNATAKLTFAFRMM